MILSLILCYGNREEETGKKCTNATAVIEGNRLWRNPKSSLLVETTFNGTVSEGFCSNHLSTKCGLLRKWETSAKSSTAPTALEFSAETVR